MKRPSLTRSLLPLPARYGARIACRIRLEQVLVTAADLVSPGADVADPEAVHRFRVAARRLGNALRDFRPALDDTLSSRPRHRLGDIADLAGIVRDCDVQRSWLGRRHPGLGAEGRDAALHVARELAVERRRALDPLHDALLDHLPRIAARLARGLRHYHLDADLDAPAGEPTLGRLLCEVVAAHCRTARDAVASVGPRTAAAAMHHARIRIKRLRDLLDLLDHAVPVTRHASGALEALQDAAGSLHDLQVLRRRITHIRPSRSRSRGDRRLVAYLDSRTARLLRAAREACRRPATIALFDRIERIAEHFPK